jgi:hypothetical protein
MSRQERHAPRRARRRRDAAEQVNTGGISDKLPPRRVKHPSNKQQMTTWFYNALIVLFILLVSGLFYFGKQLSGE